MLPGHKRSADAADKSTSQMVASDSRPPVRRWLEERMQRLVYGYGDEGEGGHVARDRPGQWKLDSRTTVSRRGRV
jgi:hypothetical protein